MGDEGTAGQQGMFVGQRFVTAGKLGLNRAVVSHEIERARQELEIQRLRVVNTVRGRAYDTIVAQRAVTLNEQLVAIGEEGVKAAEELRQAKEVSQVDVLQARVEANSAKLALSNARNEHKAAWQRLAVVMGVPEMKPSPWRTMSVETVPTFLGGLRRPAADRQPGVGRAWSGVERAKCALARAQAGRTPDVDLEAAVRYDNANESTTATIGVGVPLEVFDRNQGNISTSLLGTAAAQREVRRVELGASGSAGGGVQTVRQGPPAGRATIPISSGREGFPRMVRQGYQQGQFGYLELLTAQRTYFPRQSRLPRESPRTVDQCVEIEGLLLTGGLAPPGA